MAICNKNTQLNNINFIKLNHHCKLNVPILVKNDRVYKDYCSSFKSNLFNIGNSLVYVWSGGNFLQRFTGK